MLIRPETAFDFDAIRAVNIDAFGGSDEADLVDRLRCDDVVLLSLVAVRADVIVGHIMFTRLPIHTATAIVDAVALAPLAVGSDVQRQGIGSALIKDGVERLVNAHEQILIVVGEPRYYQRFGFSSRLARHLSCPLSGPSFMAMELRSGVLAGVVGEVKYPAAFGMA
jgi:putative acetyltransferase